MQGIGNDIIDLASIDISRTDNPRFYSKILSVTEQQLYREQFAALPFHLFVWLLWSIKESAYKCLQRYQPDLVFTPVKVAVNQISVPIQTSLNLTDELSGTGFDAGACFNSIIQLNTQMLYARSVIYSDAIHTVACFTPNFEQVNWGLKQIATTGPAHQSAEVRMFLLDRLKALYPNKQLTIAKHPSGYPCFTEDEALPLSLSHHGRYIAYAF